MHPGRINLVLWPITAAILLGILLITCRIRLYRTYPYFVSYVALQIVSYALLFGPIQSSYPVYYYPYYASLLLSAMLSTGVAWETLANSCRPYPNLLELSLVIFRWSLVLAVIASVAIAINQRPAESTFANWTLFAVRASQFAQCGLFLLLLTLYLYIGLSRRNIMFGILLGFTLLTSISTLVAGVVLVVGVYGDSGHRQSEINSVAYLSATLIWLTYAIRESVYFDRRTKTVDWLSSSIGPKF
jgi:hypothetical protein